MKIQTIVICLCILILVVSCSSESSNTDSSRSQKDPKDLIGEGEGIQVSEWYEDDGKDVINILNFNYEDTDVRVTTVCFDEDDMIIPSNDTGVLKIPARMQWKWIPVCPENSTSYNIMLKEVE